MRWAVACALMIAGCYGPHPSAGAPCDSTAQCPAHQACNVGACRAIGEDSDGDEIPDEVDNCPDVANADQGNEDGDQFGDPCDPCPIDANDTPGDLDGDGVADACDPHPDAAGDQIVLFEGFHAGLPADWQAVGTVTADADSLVVNANANDHASIVSPLAAPANATISVGIVVDGVVGTGETYAGPTMPYDASTDLGVHCQLYDPDAANTGSRHVSLWDSVASNEFGRVDLAWDNATGYTASLGRSGNQFTCAAGPTGQPLQSATGTTTSLPVQQQVGFQANSMTARVEWLLVVQSP